MDHFKYSVMWIWFLGVWYSSWIDYIPSRNWEAWQSLFHTNGPLPPGFKVIACSRIRLIACAQLFIDLQLTSFKRSKYLLWWFAIQWSAPCSNITKSMPSVSTYLSIRNVPTFLLAVGADRIAKNGDTANKVSTCLLDLNHRSLLTVAL